MTTHPAPLASRRPTRPGRAVAALLLGAVVLAGSACSSDADAPSTDETTVTTAAGDQGSSTTAGSSDTGDGSGGSGGSTTTALSDDLGSGEASAEVTAYCEEVREVAQQLQEVRANPSADAVNEINARLAELTDEATGLLEDHPDEIDQINDCAAELLDN